MKRLKKAWITIVELYGRHYTLNVGIAAFLFVWQLIHLYWLTTDVVFYKLFGGSFLSLEKTWEFLIIIVDYTEIPAIISTSFVYIFGLTQRFTWKNILFLFLLNSQWLHLFWITDEFVIHQLRGVSSVVLPIWFVFLAISIDYLELPVIFDTLKKFFASFKKKSLQ